MRSHSRAAVGVATAPRVELPSVKPANASVRTRLFVMILLAVFTVLVRVPYLAAPLERDEGEYAYTAWRIDQGDVPYRDVFDQKPPGVFLIYWLTMKVLGGSARDFHLAGTAFVVLEVILVYMLAARFARGWIAAAAALFCAWVTAGCVLLGCSANTETFGAPLMVLGVFLAFQARDRRSGLLFFLAGLAVGLGSAMKQPIMLFAAIPLLLSARAPGAGARESWSVSGPRLVLLGLATAWVPVVAYFAAKGCFQDMVYCVFRHNFEYSQGLSTGEMWTRVYRRSEILIPAFGLPVLLAVWGLVAGWRKSRDVVVLMVWAVVSVVAVLIGMQLYFHYFLMAVPAFVLAVAGGFEDCRQRMQRLSLELRRVLVVGLALATVVPPVLADVEYLGWALRDTDRLSRARYAQWLFAVSPQVGAWVDQITQSDETVFVFGSEPQMLYYARRRSATRHILSDPLFGPYRRMPEFQREVMADLTRNNPPVIIDVRTAGSVLRRPDSDPLLMTTLNKLLAQRYVPVFGGFMTTPVTNGPQWVPGRERVLRRKVEIQREANRMAAQGRPLAEVRLYVFQQEPDLVIYLRADLSGREPKTWAGIPAEDRLSDVGSATVR